MFAIIAGILAEVSGVYKLLLSGMVTVVFVPCKREKFGCVDMQISLSFQGNVFQVITSTSRRFARQEASAIFSVAVVDPRLTPNGRK